jgi:hypothetical protein
MVNPELGTMDVTELIAEYYLNADGDIDTQYVEDLEVSMRSSGVKVPFTFNDVRPSSAMPLISG